MAHRSGALAIARRLGARIRALRLEAGITQERLAWDCGLNKGYLSQIESGRHLPSIPVLFALSRRMGVEAADLVGYALTKPRLRLLDAARREQFDQASAVLRRLAGARSRG